MGTLRFVLCRCLAEAGVSVVVVESWILGGNVGWKPGLWTGQTGRMVVVVVVID